MSPSRRGWLAVPGLPGACPGWQQAAPLVRALASSPLSAAAAAAPLPHPPAPCCPPIPPRRSADLLMRLHYVAWGATEQSAAQPMAAVRTKYDQPAFCHASRVPPAVAYSHLPCRSW